MPYCSSKKVMVKRKQSQEFVKGMHELIQMYSSNTVQVPLDRSAYQLHKRKCYLFAVCSVDVADVCLCWGMYILYFVAYRKWKS